jgi:ABC-type long-subunit fatty acid transport system fused permease/ATPase subunit
MGVMSATTGTIDTEQSALEYGRACAEARRAGAELHWVEATVGAVVLAVLAAKVWLGNLAHDLQAWAEHEPQRQPTGMADRAQMNVMRLVRTVVGLGIGLAIGGVVLNEIVDLGIVNNSSSTVDVTSIVNTVAAGFSVMAIIGIAIAGRAVMRGGF